MASRLADQEKKAQIILLERFSNSFYALTDEQAGRMVKAIFQYKKTKQEPNFQGDGILAFFWQDIKNWLNDSEEYYKKICEQNKANANKRWGNNNEPNEPNDATAYDRIQMDANYPNANAMANVKSYPNKGSVNIDSTNKGNTDFEKMVALYEEKIEGLKPGEKAKFQELIKNNSLGDIKSAIDWMVVKDWKGVFYLQKALKEASEMNVDF